VEIFIAVLFGLISVGLVVFGSLSRLDFFRKKSVVLHDDDLVDPDLTAKTRDALR
jgi:hypothetical protein